MTTDELRAAGYVPLDELPESLQGEADVAVQGPDGRDWFKIEDDKPNLFD